MGTAREVLLAPEPVRIDDERSPGPRREPGPSRLTTILLGCAALAITAVAIGLVYRHLARASALPDGLIQVNGRIEGDTVRAAGKLVGRIAVLAVREGDEVTAGQLLARFDDATPRARHEQVRAAEEAAWARVAAARADLAVLRRTVPLAVASAEAALGAAQAGLGKARASEEQARRERERAALLRTGGALDPQGEEKLDLAWQVARDELRRAGADAVRAERALADARLGPARVRARVEEVRVLEAVARQARALVAEAQTVLDDLAVVSPIAGTVTTRFVDAGEVMAAGAPLFEIVDLDRLYLKAFVRERDVGRVRLGLPARVFTDAFPDDPFPAKVRHVASRAEFTPKEVQTPDERARLVYAVKLYLEANPDHRLTPGLSADALIRWKDGTPWARPRW